MFALLLVAGDSVRSTPGRPEQLALAGLKDAGALKCPMCSNAGKAKPKVRWDMHAPDHGTVMQADARGYMGTKGNVFARNHGGGPVDCMSHPHGAGCAGPH